MPRFIPLITTPAGLSLTMANWESTSTTEGAYQLQNLLVKPGLEVLNKINNLKNYNRWYGKIILDANLNAAQQDCYKFYSPYNGSLICIKTAKLLPLICQLQPNIVLLPFDVSPQNILFPTNIIPVFNLAHATSILCNKFYYFAHQAGDPFDIVLTHLKKYPIQLKFLYGEFNFLEFIQLAKYNINIVSDTPARYGIMGLVYNQNTTSGLLNILDVAMAEQQIVIDENCHCPTCRQKFTRAYLHYLFTHTPLLCHRFLVQHNIFYINNYLCPCTYLL